MESLRTSSDDFVRNVVNREFAAAADDDIETQTFKKPTALTFAELITDALLRHKRSEQHTTIDDTDESDSEVAESDKSEMSDDQQPSDDDEQLQLALALSMSQVEEDERRRVELARKSDEREFSADLQRSIRHQLFTTASRPLSRVYEHTTATTTIPKQASFEFDDIDHLSHAWETDFQTAMDRRRSQRLTTITRRKQTSSRFIRISANLFDEVLAGQKPRIERKVPEQKVVADTLCPFPPHVVELFEGSKAKKNRSQNDDDDDDDDDNGSHKNAAASTAQTTAANQPVFLTGNTTVPQMTRAQERHRKKQAAIARFAALRSQRRGKNTNAETAAAPAKRHVMVGFDQFDHFRFRFYMRHRHILADAFGSEPWKVQSLSLLDVNSAVASRFLNARKTHEPCMTFHGTAIQNHEPICRQGFIIPGQKGIAVANGSAYGCGTYSSRTPGYSVHYARGERSMLVCAVIDDTREATDAQYREGHCISKNAHSHKTKCVNNIVVSFDTSHIVPLFRMHFTERTDTGATLTSTLTRNSTASIDLVKRARNLVRRMQQINVQVNRHAYRYNARQTSQALDNML